jgi:hypothetical protein
MPRRLDVFALRDVHFVNAPRILVREYHFAGPDRFWRLRLPERWRTRLDHDLEIRERSPRDLHGVIHTVGIHRAALQQVPGEAVCVIVRLLFRPMQRLARVMLIVTDLR